jgi:hypothetical protein
VWKGGVLHGGGGWKEAAGRRKSGPLLRSASITRAAQTCGPPAGGRAGARRWAVCALVRACVRARARASAVAHGCGCVCACVRLRACARATRACVRVRACACARARRARARASCERVPAASRKSSATGKEPRCLISDGPISDGPISDDPISHGPPQLAAPPLPPPKMPG